MTAVEDAALLNMPSISPPGLTLLRELLQRSAIMMRFSHLEERELLAVLADDMFMVLHTKFEVYLKSLCSVILPADQHSAIKKVNGEKVNSFLNLLEKQLGMPLVDQVARTMLSHPRRRRNSLTHDAQVLGAVQPGTAPQAFSLFDQLPEGQQHFVQAGALIFSTVAHIETTLSAQRPTAFHRTDEDGLTRDAALFPGDAGLDHLPRALESMTLKPGELLRMCSVLGMFQQAVPEGWPLPMPPLFEAALTYLHFGLLHVISEGVVEIVFTDEFTAALTQSGVLFTVNPEALTRAVFTQEEAFGSAWGVVWYPNLLAAYWPLDELPDVVRAHFQLPSPEEADALA